MPNFGKELADLNFGAMIGGPLMAVVKAQAAAAETTVAFVKKVGFGGGQKAEVVTFGYTKTIPDAQGKMREQECQLSVPLLTLMPIPFLRVEDVTIDFNCKLTSCDQTSHEDTDTASVEGSGSADFLFGSVDFKASYSHQSKNTSSSKVDRTYSLSVRVHAVQDQMPAGMERILHILESCIHEKTDAAGGGGAPAAKPAAPPAK